MDEPLSNLDARLREEVRGKIRELAKQLGSTVLYVTHDQIEAMAVADKIALMQSGELPQVGAPMELYRHPLRVEVAEFFGLVNWVKGKVTQAGVADTPVGRLHIAAMANHEDEILLGIRPESLMIVEGQPAPQSNLLQATFHSCTFLGDQFVYSVRVGDRLLVGKNRVFPAHVNGQLWLRVAPDDIMVFPARDSSAPSGFDFKAVAAGGATR